MSHNEIWKFSNINKLFDDSMIPPSVALTYGRKNIFLSYTLAGNLIYRCILVRMKFVDVFFFVHSTEWHRTNVDRRLSPRGN